MDPEEIYSTVVECIEKTCGTLQEMGITLDEIKAVGIANQRGIIFAIKANSHDSLF